MPLYVYQCTACQAETEQRRSFADADKPLSCAICEAPCQRTLSTFGMRKASQDANVSEIRFGQWPQRSRHRPACVCCTPRR